MEIPLDSQPQPQVPQSPVQAGGARPMGWVHGLLLLVFLGSFGIALMRLGERNEARRSAPPDEEELQSLQALWNTKLQHERPWTAATSGWYQAWAPHATWHGVPPLWPWLMSFGGPVRGDDSAGETLMELHKAGRPLPAWVEEVRAKVLRVNLWLTWGFLLLLALGVGRQWSLLGTVNLALVLGWVVLWPLQFRATPETLSMILLLLTSFCAVRLLQKNTAWRHVQFGLLAGMAYLTDVTILPLLAGWLLVTTARFLRGLLDKSAEGSWTCRGHFIGLLALVFAFLAVTVPNLSFHRVQDGKALFPIFNHYEPSLPKSSQEFRARTMEGLETMVKLSSEANPSAKLQPSGSLILGGLTGMLLIAVASAARGPASSGIGVAIFAEYRSAFYLLLLTGILYAATANPGPVLWPVFALCVLLLTLGAESLQGWARRRGLGGGFPYALFTGLQLVVTVHLMICMFQYFRELTNPS